MRETGPAKKAATRRPPVFDARKAHKYAVVQGCDEVGRGALSGPVVCCVVYFDPARIPGALLSALNDSKVVPAHRRELLDAEIRRHARVTVSSGSARHIDRLGIRNVTLETMRLAVARLDMDAPLMVDGVDLVPGVKQACQAIVKGDSKIPQIAAASIVAKVCRDRIMRRLALRYPGYGWERNVGYGTADHMSAIRTLGATGHHRHSFGTVGHYGASLQSEAAVACDDHVEPMHEIA